MQRAQRRKPGTRKKNHAEAGFDPTRFKTELSPSAPVGGQLAGGNPGAVRPEPSKGLKVAACVSTDLSGTGQPISKRQLLSPGRSTDDNRGIKEQRRYSYFFTSESRRSGRPSRQGGRPDLRRHRRFDHRQDKAFPHRRQKPYPGLVIADGRKSPPPPNVDYPGSRATIKRIGYDKHRIRHRLQGARCWWPDKQADIAQGREQGLRRQPRPGRRRPGLILATPATKPGADAAADLPLALPRRERQAQLREMASCPWPRQYAKSLGHHMHENGKGHRRRRCGAIADASRAGHRTADPRGGDRGNHPAECCPSGFDAGARSEALRQPHRPLRVVGGPASDCGLTGRKHRRIPMAAWRPRRRRLLRQGSVEGRLVPPPTPGLYVAKASSPPALQQVPGRFLRHRRGSSRPRCGSPRKAPPSRSATRRSPNW